jgi:hypothetical protein
MFKEPTHPITLDHTDQATDSKLYPHVAFTPASLPHVDIQIKVFCGVKRCYDRKPMLTITISRVRRVQQGAGHLHNRQGLSLALAFSRLIILLLLGVAGRHVVTGIIVVSFSHMAVASCLFNTS